MCRSVCLSLLLFLIISLLDNAHAQPRWTLASDQDGIKVYTRPVADSKVKAVRVTCTLAASATQTVAAILDIKTCNEWVYHSKQNVLIKQNSPTDLIYYSEVEVPWPAENRDYVVHVQVEQNPQTKVVTVNSPCIPGFVAEKKGIVRISRSVGRWTITPVSKNLVKAEYVLEVDPMGDIPAWLINLFASKGPHETFRKLKTHVQKDVYKKTDFATIAD
jgi:hypothetical protein